MEGAVLYEVRGADGQAVRVEAVDWMMAMCQAIALMGIEVSGWMCSTMPEGQVNVIDPISGHSWMVRKLDPSEATEPLPPPPPTPLQRPSASMSTAPPPPRRSRPQGADASDVARLPAYSPPPLPEPEPEPPKPPEEEAPEDLAEQLFDLSTDLFIAPNSNAAAKMALDILMRIITCEAGSVMRGTRREGELTFVACAGPAAKKLIGKKMTFGEGVVGATFDLGITILVDDVTQDDRHMDRFDKETGFKTKSVLCAPIRQQHAVYGAVELINPKARFQPWHIETMETVARTLASIVAEGR